MLTIINYCLLYTSSLPGAPYICLEPWMGRCDNYGFKDEISEKPDIVTLKPEEIFQHGYSVTLSLIHIWRCHMYAIIATGGKQYKVAEGDIIRVEKLGVEACLLYTSKKQRKKQN